MLGNRIVEILYYAAHGGLNFKFYLFVRSINLKTHCCSILVCQTIPTNQAPKC